LGERWYSAVYVSHRRAGPVQALFIRHSFSGTPRILADLWNDRRIAVHYDENWSTDPEDYAPAGKKALKKLWNCCESGAVVGAAFRSIRPSSMLVGEVEAGSPVEALRYSDPGAGQSFIYKTVQLRKAQEVLFRDYPLLAGIQPRLTTITGWPSARAYLMAILGRTELPQDVSSLHPSQLEVLCYEYMRWRGDIGALLLPIGRNMLDVDIVGVGTNGATTLAQVTHSTEPKAVSDKLQRLESYGDPAGRLLFFGPASAEAGSSSVEFVGIEQAFQSLREHGSAAQQKMLRRMLEWRTARS
jgi:hypothetical protein